MTAGSPTDPGADGRDPREPAAYPAFEEDTNEPGSAETDAIVDALQEALVPVVRYSANDETFLEVTTYSLLSLIWGKRAPWDNIHDDRVGDPYVMESADTTTLRAFHEDQDTAILDSWARIRELIAETGVRRFAEALAARAPWFPVARAVLHAWNEAEYAYGPHPAGITVARLQTDSGHEHFQITDLDT